MLKRSGFSINRNILLLAFLLLSALLPVRSFAAIQVDSVKTTASTCPNNGTITVYASTNAPAILYSIIAGPVTQGVQTNNQFNSLPAGSYTIKVTNAASETATQTVTVTGNYAQLDFNPVSTGPYCHGGSDGSIVGNLVPGTGNGPYTWELLSPSPVVVPAQANDTFNNLIAGNYTVRVTDACGSFRTIVATVVDPPATGLVALDYLSQVNIIGCDSAMYTLPLQATAYRFPITCTFQTTAGTFTTTSPTKVDTSFGNGYFVIQQLLTPFIYGNYLSVTITDACGNSASTRFLSSQPFSFCNYTSNEYLGCDYITHVSYDLNNVGCFGNNDVSTYGKAPFIVQITDGATAVVINKDTVKGYQYIPGYNTVSGFYLPTLTPNKSYFLSVTDSCGNLYAENFFVPLVAPPPPRVEGIQLSPDACVDSVGLATINISNFAVNPKVVFLSGPATMGSTKPGYEYSNTHAYPDTITEHGHFFGTALDIFFISGLSVGTYQFKVIDSCGAEVFDSLVITATDVTNFSHKFSYKKGCLGQNGIYYAVNNPSGQMTITNLSTGVASTKYYSSQDWANPIKDSLLNLPSGSYAIDFIYSGYLSGSVNSTTTLAATPLICQEITDTITIEGYQNPAVTTSNSILCNNVINVQLLPDSSKGVPPYQYEIIAGPQTFPVQNSNIFTVNTAGTYTARIYDVCGNATTASITVDTLSFPPITPLQTSCNSIQLFYGSADYYTYSWTGPNNQAYVGDTLSINPITPADTGVYHIARMVDINGCKDTVYTTYRLTFPVTYNQTKEICTSNSITVGTHTYNTTGIYRDTLTSINGCDSIVVLNLTVVANKKDSLVRNICTGQSITVGTHIYNQTGIYRDTLTTSTCDSIVVLNLTVSPAKKDSLVRNICAGQSINVGTHTYNQTGIYRDTLTTTTCDSIVVLNLTVSPVKKDSLLRNICAGQSFTVGTHTYNQTGIYRDTLTTSTCDSIVVLNLTVSPIKKDSLLRNICAGQSITVGTHTYNQTGIYRDTLTTTTCDSIVVLNLTVASFKKDSLVRNVCAGQSITVGTHIYNQTGIYRDTLTTSTCDSIVVLNLTVAAVKRDSMSRTICQGQSVTIGTHTYNQTGIYRDTLATSTCDSIIVLNLLVNPNPSINITATPQVVDPGGTVQLNTTTATTYLWTSVAQLNNNAIQNPVATLSVSSWVYLQATANPGNCIARDSIFIIVRVPDTTLPCSAGSSPYIYLPKAFSPNGDGKNDLFRIKANNVLMYEFIIFNRWGQPVFQTKDINKAWDGTYKGRILPGNYVYMISYSRCTLSNKEILKGNVVLIK